MRAAKQCHPANGSLLLIGLSNVAPALRPQTTGSSPWVVRPRRSCSWVRLAAPHWPTSRRATVTPAPQADADTRPRWASGIRDEVIGNWVLHGEPVLRRRFAPETRGHRVHRGRAAQHVSEMRQHL